MEFTAESSRTAKAEKGDLNYLFFRVGEYSFALDIDSLVRVVDLSVGGERREGVKVIDLRDILGVSGGSAGGFQVDLRIRDRDYSLYVDSVLGIRNFQLAIPLDFPEAIRNERNRGIRGFFFDGEKMVCRIDAEELVISILEGSG